MSPRRLLVYCDAQKSAATVQIRVESALRECGFDLVYAHDYHRHPARLARIVQRDVDGIVVQRTIRKRCRIYETLLETARQHSKPVIYDTDDLLIRVCQTHPDYPIYRARALHALRALVNADYVVASTRVLADHLAAFHSHITFVPNRLPRGLWRDVCQRRAVVGAERHADGITVGYIASRTHAPDLEFIEDALLAVLARHQGQLRFLSVGVPLPSRLRVHPAAESRQPPRKVSRDYREFVSFAADLAIDVGVAPLADNPFNRCKSDVKFQEYSALGIPAVYSDLPPYRDSVQDGINGCLAGNMSEWEDRLCGLIESPELRHRMKATAAHEVMASWEAGTQEPAWNEVLSR